MIQPAMSGAALPNRKPLVVAQTYSQSAAAEQAHSGFWHLVSCLWICLVSWPSSRGRSWAGQGQGRVGGGARSWGNSACRALRLAALALVVLLVLMYSPRFLSSPTLLPRLPAHVGLAAAPGKAPEGVPRHGAGNSSWPRAALDPRSICPALPDPPWDSGTTVPKHYPAPVTYDRQECWCTPVHSFVVLSMQRSGSGWFESLLNSHPNVSSLGEVFSHNRWHKLRLPGILATLDSVYNLEFGGNHSAAKSECTAAVGFKWMLNQGLLVHKEAIREYLVRHRVSVVFLYRRNLLRRLVSLLANQKDKQMKLLDDEHQSHAFSQMEANVLSAYRPLVDLKRMRRVFEKDERSIADVVRAFKATRMMRVPYEDVLRGNGVLERVQRFLGLPAAPLDSTQVRIHARPLSESIRNYKDVARALRGTKYEIFLRD